MQQNHREIRGISVGGVFYRFSPVSKENTAIYNGDDSLQAFIFFLTAAMH